jgi:hypothetical protein
MPMGHTKTKNFKNIFFAKFSNKYFSPETVERTLKS